MGVVAQFNYNSWIQRYPEFSSTITQANALTLFAEAAMYHRNDGGGPVCNAAEQSTFLNMVTAHLAQLYFGAALPTGPQPAAPLVGRVASASEGSVSVQVQNDYPPGTVQWWQQTKYGASYWALSVPYRTFRYIVGPQRIFDQFPPWPFIR